MDYEALLADVNLSKLQEVFRFMMKRQEDKIDPVRSTFGKIEKDEVDMDQKVLYVEEFIKTQKSSIAGWRLSLLFLSFWK